MSIAGYNFYLNGVKANTTLEASPTFTFDGLASHSDYNLQATAVDAAGNESPLSTVLSAATNESTNPDAPVSADQASAIDAIVAASMADPNSVPQGVIVDVTGPAGKYRKAYGTTGSRPVSTDDHFRIGSITKMFVAMAAWKQIDAGTLSLDDKIEQFVPGIPNGTIITMAHLMSMRSGVYDFMSDLLGWQIPYYFFPTGSYSEAQAINLAKGASQFAPGSQYLYDNSNAVLIGAVLEKILNKPITQVLHEEVIEPLGLTETQWPGYPGVTSVNIQEPNMGNWQFNPDYVQCAGSLTSNINDLTKFAKAMRDGDLISTQSWNTWFHEFPTVESLGALSTAPALFGYGYFMMSYGRWFGHGGSCPGGNGYVTACLFDPLTGATITVAENKQTANASAFYVIGNKVAELLYPGSMTSPTYPIPSDITVTAVPASLAVVAGSPSITVEPANKLLVPAGASLALAGGTPGSSEINPVGASLAISGGTPSIDINSPVAVDSFASAATYYDGSLAFNHTVADGAVVIVDVNTDWVPQSMTYGGVPMTLVASCYYGGSPDNPSAGVLFRYIKTGLSAGTSEVKATFVGPHRASMTAVSYVNVGSVGSTTQVFNPGTSAPSHAVTCSVNQKIVQTFGERSGAAFSSWSGGTNRGHRGGGDIGAYYDIVVNDAASSTTFSATGPSGMYWGSIATILNGGA